MPGEDLQLPERVAAVASGTSSGIRDFSDTMWPAAARLIRMYGRGVETAADWVGDRLERIPESDLATRVANAALAGAILGWATKKSDTEKKKRSAIPRMLLYGGAGGGLGLWYHILREKALRK